MVLFLKKAYQVGCDFIFVFDNIALKCHGMV